MPETILFHLPHFPGLQLCVRQPAVVLHLPVRRALPGPHLSREDHQAVHRRHPHLPHHLLLRLDLDLWRDRAGDGEEGGRVREVGASLFIFKIV